MLLNETVPQWVIDITVDVSNLNIIVINNVNIIGLEHLVVPGSFAMHSGRCRPGDLMDSLV